jgi:vacuolar-type H+-ATPase subunit I/STV1
LGIQVYDLLSRPGIEDRERAKIIAEALETVQQNYPNLATTATQRDLSETELRLLDKIEMTHERIEKTRLEIKDVELRLTKEIESVRVDLTKEIESVRVDLTKEMGKQTMRTVTYLTAIMGLFYAIVRFVPA